MVALKNRNRLDFLRFVGAPALGRGCEAVAFGAVSVVMSGTIVAPPVARGAFPKTLTGTPVAATAELGGVWTRTEPDGLAGRTFDREQPFGFLASDTEPTEAQSATAANRVQILIMKVSALPYPSSGQGP